MSDDDGFLGYPDVFGGDGKEPPPRPPAIDGAGNGGERRQGLTAMEAAEILIPDIHGDRWRKRDTIRRRVQELHEPYGLLDVIGERPGTETKHDNQVYAANDRTKAAATILDSGGRHLVRYTDPKTSHEAVRKLRKDTDFHRIVSLFTER